MLDESQSFGMIGAHGKGVTEHYGIPVGRTRCSVYFQLSGYRRARWTCSLPPWRMAVRRVEDSALDLQSSAPIRRVANRSL